MNSKLSAAALLAKVDQVEGEMRRVGYWSNSSAPALDQTALFSGVSFEKWLQFEYLPKLREAIRNNVFAAVPPYKVGLSALRQYDYHSSVPEAHQLMELCFELESLLALVLPAQDNP
jgi:uncharacterized protein YqcC (DUF446 family)